MSELGGWFTQFVRDRTATPLFPTFIWAWCVINWRVIYLTLFISHENIPDGYANKIAYIESMLTWCSNIIWPGLLALAILGPIQWMGNLAYWVSLFFRSQRLNWKNEKINKFRMFSQDQVNERLQSQQSVNDSLSATLRDQLGELQRVRGENASLTATSRDFQIVDAKYGSVNRFNDVTTQVKVLGANEGQLTVSNAALGGDPYPGVVKTLIVHYRNKGQQYTSISLEDDIFKFKDGQAEVIDGKHSLAMKAELEKDLRAIEEQRKKDQQTRESSGG